MATAAARAKFAAAPSLEEVRRLMVQFVEGKLAATPWHGGPLTPDTRDEAAVLASLHRRGLMTFDGQPGRAETGYNPETKRHWQIEQREYVIAMAERGLAARLYADLTAAGFYCYVNLPDFGLLAPPAVRYPVTRERIHRRRTRVAKKRWRFPTRLANYLEVRRGGAGGTKIDYSAEARADKWPDGFDVVANAFRPAVWDEMVRTLAVLVAANPVWCERRLFPALDRLLLAA